MKRTLFILVALSLLAPFAWAEEGGEEFGGMTYSPPLAIPAGGMTFYADYESGTLTAPLALGSPTSTFTASRGASNPATYIDDNGVIQVTTTSNEPRFNRKIYTSSGLIDAQGLLIEAAGTNLLTYSADYSNAAWAKTNASIVTGESSFVSTKGILAEDFENILDWTVGGTDATQQANNTNFKTGAQSLQLNASGGNAAYSTKTINSNLSAITQFSFWIYVTDSSKLESVTMYLSSVADWSKYFSVGMGTSTVFPFKTGWNHFVVTRNQFSTTGAESWSNAMIRLRVRIAPKSGQTTSASWETIRIAGSARPKIIFTFDDGFENVYENALPIMRENGLTGVVYAITDAIGTTNYLSAEQLGELYSAGWDISNHSKTHQDLRGLSDAELNSEIVDSYNILYGMGFTRSARFFAYPYGYFDANAIAKVKGQHVMARDATDSRWQAHIDLDDDLQWNVKAFGVVNTTSVANLESYIENIIASSGVLVLMFHQIVDSGADISTKWLTADFETICAYVKALVDANSVDVVTMSDYYDGYVFNPSALPSQVIEAEDANGTVLQAYTGAATSRTYSVYLRRKEGTGAISITGDGANYSEKTLYSDRWVRVSDTRSQLNPSVGIKFASAYDSVYVHYSQYEASPYATTIIPTTTAALTRNAESLYYETSGNRNANEETCAIKFIPEWNGTDLAGSATLIDTGSKLRRIWADTNDFCRFQPNGSDNGACLCNASTKPSAYTPYVVATTCKHSNPYAEIYMDGVREGTETSDDYTNNAWGTCFYLGVDKTPANYLNGIIQKVAIFNRALSSTEVANVSDALD